jgi:hypothetical protein
MKSESEEFCKSSFEQYLKETTPASTIFWKEVDQKDEPPEYYLCLNGTKYAVEVTILIQKVDVEARKHLPVAIVRDLFAKFVANEIELVARNGNFLQGSYLVYFSKPIVNFARVKGIIKSEVLSYISATQAVSKAPAKIVYERARQKCVIEKLHSEENQVVMGGPVISRWKSDALVEVGQLLNDRLEEKEYKLRNINHPKILLLHNKYYFDVLGTYKPCISTLPSLQSFHAVFSVESPNVVQLLYSQRPDWPVSPRHDDAWRNP